MLLWKDIADNLMSGLNSFIYLDLFDKNLENSSRALEQSHISDIDKRYIQLHRNIFSKYTGQWNDYGKYVRVDTLPSQMTPSFVYSIMTFFRRPFY